MFTCPRPWTCLLQTENWPLFPRNVSHPKTNILYVLFLNDSLRVAWVIMKSFCEIKNKPGFLFGVNTYSKIMNVSVTPTHFVCFLSWRQSLTAKKILLFFCGFPWKPPNQSAPILYLICDYSNSTLFLLFETVEETRYKLHSRYFNSQPS